MADTGFVFPGTAVGNRAVSGGGPSWSDPDNIKVDDTSDATTTVAGTRTLGLAATNFDFSSVSGTIDGIEVQVGDYSRTESVPGDLIWTVAVAGGCNLILADDSDGSENKEDEFLIPTGSDQTDQGGGASDLWGETISDTDVKDVDWGFFISWESSGGGQTPQVDFMQMKVYFTNPVTITSVNAGSAWTDGDTDIAIVGTNLV